MTGWIFFGIIAVIFLSWGIFTAVKTKKEKKRAEDARKALLEQRRVEQEEKERIEQMRKEERIKRIADVKAAFQKNGWKDWADELHESDDQYRRILRIRYDGPKMRICLYDPEAGIAKIKGTSGNYYLTSGHRCSCFDFKNRQMPCKHMYFLALNLPESKPIDFTKCRDTLKGLSFSIIGYGQTPVKKYIEANGGEHGRFNCWSADAVVLASDIQSKALDEAREKNIEIIPFEKFRHLFETEQERGC